MIITFLEGIQIPSEKEIEGRLFSCLKKLTRQADSVTCLFFASSPFISASEWAVRKLEALHPDKIIERVGVSWEDEKASNRFRYTRIEQLTEDRVGGRGEPWKWMIDHSDHIITYMDTLVCNNYSRILAYRYAYGKSGVKCHNLCSKEEMDSIRQKIPTLPRWQREAMEAKLRGERKKETAGRLGISRNTLHQYEVQAQAELCKRQLRGTEDISRKCAILDLYALNMSEDRIAKLDEVLSYLLDSCHVREFILAGSRYVPNGQLMERLGKISKFNCIKPRLIWTLPRYEDVPKGSTEKDILRYDRGKETYAGRNMEERKAMIDAADIILCDTKVRYRSGLSRAETKHIPIINLADY